MSETEIEGDSLKKQAGYINRIVSFLMTFQNGKLKEGGTEFELCE